MKNMIDHIITTMKVLNIEVIKCKKLFQNAEGQWRQAFPISNNSYNDLISFFVKKRNEGMSKLYIHSAWATHPIVNPNTYEMQERYCIYCWYPPNFCIGKKEIYLERGAYTRCKHCGKMENRSSYECNICNIGRRIDEIDKSLIDLKEPCPCDHEWIGWQWMMDYIRCTKCGEERIECSGEIITEKMKWRWENA